MLMLLEMLCCTQMFVWSLYLCLLICLHKLPVLVLAVLGNPTKSHIVESCGKHKVAGKKFIRSHFPWPSCAPRSSYYGNPSWGITWANNGSSTSRHIILLQYQFDVSLMEEAWSIGIKSATARKRDLLETFKQEDNLYREEDFLNFQIWFSYYFFPNIWENKIPKIECFSKRETCILNLVKQEAIITANKTSGKNPIYFGWIVTKSLLLVLKFGLRV